MFIVLDNELIDTNLQKEMSLIEIAFKYIQEED